MGQTAASVRASYTLEDNHVLLGVDDKSTAELWQDSWNAKDLLKPTQRFLQSVEEEKEWVMSLDDIHHKQAVAQACIYKWKHQYPPGRFLKEYPKFSRRKVEVDDDTVERSILQYFTTWTATPALTFFPYTGTADLRSSGILIAQKILKAWQGHGFRNKLQEIYRFELTSVDIDVTTWLDPLLSDTVQENDCMIDLEPLRHQLAQGLYIDCRTNKPKERFFPSSIYVRREMQGIFQLFCRDVNLPHNREEMEVSSIKSSIILPRKKATVFMGSSGVGKSILFFLAALYRSQNTVTIFIRQSPVLGEDMSVFIMFPKPDETGKVQVLFTRRLRCMYLSNGLSGLTLFLKRNLHLEREEVYIFLDGAEYNKNRPDDTICGEFDFLCTSEGYPFPRSRDYGHTRQWFMSGWTPEEAEAAFVTLHSDTEEVRRKAREAYALCGGKMRDMRRAFDDPEEVQNWICRHVRNLSQRQFTVSLYSSAMTSVDHIHTLFRKDLEKFDSDCIQQYVDSKFSWRILARKLGTEELVKEYNYIIDGKGLTRAGWHFENTVHAWFFERLLRRQEDSIVTTVTKVDITSDKNCVQWIQEKKQYWVPPSLHFRNIDSALVINNTLYAFQVTIHRERDFDASTFFHDFCGTMVAFNITSVTFCVITTKPDFALVEHLNKVNGGVQSNSTSLDVLKHLAVATMVPRDCCMHVVNMSDIKSFHQSMNGLMTAIRHCEERKRKTPTAAIPEVTLERSLRRFNRIRPSA
jgi:hypothetical protein